MPETKMLELAWPLSEKAQSEIDDKKRKPSKEETGKEEKALPEEPAASVKRKGRGQRPLSDYWLP
jgi:hypothetical protein